MVATWPMHNPTSGSVYIYADLSAAGAPASPSYTIDGPLLFGTSVGGGAINAGDSLPDLVIGQGSATNTSAWTLWQKTSGGPFDTPIDLTTPKFWISRFDGNTIAGTASNSLGRSNTVGDLTNDALLDIVLADQLNNTVYVWH